ncbi:MAG TPA: peptidyl-prolyl cis-trans isomerase [Candidatus Acidoferrum sp.]|nr:peptidyl-prolyl cis-trans isomerase [Candidatus Acidoferrum sp.]
MKYLVVFALLLAMAVNASSQVSSHAPTAPAKANSPATSPFLVSDKPVAKVNGAVLTDRDLLREMLQIFPYAGQHNGFPKEQEASIRQGALQMIIFEELVYQEAQRRKLTVPPQQLKQSEVEFKRQFHSPQEYQQYLNSEMGGSDKNVLDKIKRSLLIEQVLKADVENKSTITPAEVKAFYDKNPNRFQVRESYSFQTISIMPPLNATPDQKKEASKRANDFLRQAQATKNYQDFGLLAEKISEDDFRVNMGDHKAVEKDKLPPQVIKALSVMKPGGISGLIQIESAYTIVRLNTHTLAGKQSFESVKAALRTELQKSKYENLRVGLDKSLRNKARVEIL